MTAAWGKEISAYFELHKRYPKVQKQECEGHGEPGAQPAGACRVGRRLQWSGDALYDEAAISMIRRSDPVPPAAAKLIADDEFELQPGCEFSRAE